MGMSVAAAVLRRHRRTLNVWSYLHRASAASVLTAPAIYALILPLALLDLFVTVYQYVCFPLYRIARVRRQRYFIFDRHLLTYLNVFEKANCAYCSYANGVLAYAREVAARTETYWCPIKHARRPSDAHRRYARFVDYGDAAAYRARLSRLERTLSARENAGGRRQH
jgi:hypothetical protein